jgi:hypothetical protein
VAGSRGEDPNPRGKLAEPRLGRPPFTLQQLHHQALNRRVIVDFLRGESLGLEQGINRLMVFAPLPVPLGDIQQVGVAPL